MLGILDGWFFFLHFIVVQLPFNVSQWNLPHRAHFFDGCCCCCPFPNRIKGCLIPLHFYWFFAIAFLSEFKKTMEYTTAKECGYLKHQRHLFGFAHLNFELWLIALHAHILLFQKSFSLIKFKRKKFLFFSLQVFRRRSWGEKDAHRHFFSRFVGVITFFILRLVLWSEWKMRAHESHLWMAQKLVPSKNLINRWQKEIPPYFRQGIS